jgi:NAD(P)-dependent dehydrogenase (short-subunit alcohol dehydrogenase family)
MPLGSGLGSSRRNDPALVMITGAAGDIGRATVEAFLGTGRQVVGLDRRVTSIPTDDRHRHIVVDLTDEATVRQAVNRSLGDDRVVHLVGIAGGALQGEPATQDDPASIDIELFRASIEQNLTSQFIALRAFLERDAGPSIADRSVTFTSSFNALSSQGMPAYSAAKAGLIGLMYALVAPLGRLGIRVNVVAPGTLRTPRTESQWENVPGHFERLQAGTALGRLAEPADIAATFVALALDLHHITGQVLTVDGGQTAIHGPRL